MKKTIMTMVALVMMVFTPVVASANDLDLQPVPIRDMEVMASLVRWDYSEGTMLPMTKDDVKNQKRVPAYIVGAPFSYRVPKDARIERGRMDIGDGGFLSPLLYQDSIDSSSYEARFLYANDSSGFDLYEVESLMHEEYGADGWVQYSIKNTMSFWEKTTADRNISYGEFGSGSGVFALITRPKEGVKKKDWWNRNILQGLELFRADQSMLYYGNGGAPYIAKINVDYSNIKELPARMRGKLNFYTSDSNIRFIPDAEYDRKYGHIQYPVAEAIGKVMVRQLEMLADGTYIFYY